MKHRLVFLFIITGLSLIMKDVFAEAQKKRVAVLEIEAKNAPAAYAEITRDMVELNLHRSGAFQVLERNQMKLVLKEQGFSLSGCTETSCAVDIGKVLLTEIVVVGSLSKFNNYIILLKFIDVTKGEITIADSENAETEDGIEDAVNRLVLRITGSITGKKTEVPVKKGVFEGKTGKALSKSEYYFRGIVPGWGQIYAGNLTKGYLYLGGFFLAGAAAVYAVMDFNKKEAAYMDLPRDTAQSEFDKKNKDMERAGLFAISMLFLTGSVYAANWVDFIFFTDEPSVKTALRESEVGDIYFTADANYTTPYIHERQYSMSIGLRF